jgi:DNA-binding FadR family transcriptional regulator
MDTSPLVVPPARPRRKARSLTEEVVNALSEQIRNGEFRPGEKLPTESAIMDAQGVSRTVVREAISRLQAARLVETRHGIGTFVLEAAQDSSFQIDTASILTMLDVMAILELRISLEAEAAGLAANRRSETHLRQMRQAMTDFDNHIVKRTGNAVSADVAFHLAIASATGNRYFLNILEQLGSTIIPRTRVNSAALADADQTSYLAQVNREHENIVDAIERRDPEAARAAMRTHLTNSRERLRRAHDAVAQPSPVQKLAR